ncbi:hypothetical protein BLA29_005899 [Euroglyphus maynei]|uniref:G-protein coupled receptors family 1 profile domain-containing protein n=1 Tax=Euroglyphus maynei TaxID=6958 RepID=A0A1Y3AMN7_EURMA|nr:hypothetical protein BLA29_005899 [Euroglyphus maynei]
MILNISADKFFNKNLYKFNHHNPQENEESKLFTQNELPGEFGIPHSSIKSKQELCGNIENHMPIVRCYPTPDAFNPCEDVMGKNYLRFVVWLVAFAAVSGNVAVIVVLMR